MEAIGIIGITQGLYRDNGKENGSYRDYRDYVGFREVEWKSKWKLL